MEIRQTSVFVRDDHPERPLRFPTHSEAISTVESTTSRLYIRAPIIQLLIGRNCVGHDSGHTEPFECEYCLDTNRDVLHSMAQTPDYDAEWGDGVDVLWLPIGRGVNERSSAVGLLVQELPNEGKGVYCRYGVLEYYCMQDEERLREVKDIILI
jgi:hypothetical protein